MDTKAYLAESIKGIFEAAQAPMSGYEAQNVGNDIHNCVTKLEKCLDVLKAKKLNDKEQYAKKTLEGVVKALKQVSF